MGQKLIFLLVDIINSEEGAGEGAGLAKGYEERGVNLALGVDEDATEEEDEASKGEDKGGYELEVGFHKVQIVNVVRKIRRIWTATLFRRGGCEDEF